ncbi:hypothetical protein APHAL10511_002465 [Amanita phalloides]|nr:hypothetical protein APHAL10511_002465 [Amanita phalloides]
MSLSPPIRRYSNPHTRQEDLINAYEAEEERIINTLSRKLEQLREEKISLENSLEAESEFHVNRLSRELSVLRQAQQQQQNQNANGVSPDARFGLRSFMAGRDPASPSMETMFEAMRRENEQLRNRLADTERDYIRIKRLNEIYREELIEHRRRLGPLPFRLPPRLTRPSCTLLLSRHGGRTGCPFPALRPKFPAPSTFRPRSVRRCHILRLHQRTLLFRSRR